MKCTPTTEFRAVTVGVKPVEESLQTLLRHPHPSWIKAQGVCLILLDTAWYCFILSDFSASSCLLVQGSEASGKVLGRPDQYCYCCSTVICHRTGNTRAEMSIAAHRTGNPHLLCPFFQGAHSTFLEDLHKVFQCVAQGPYKASH